MFYVWDAGGGCHELLTGNTKSVSTIWGWVSKIEVKIQLVLGTKMKGSKISQNIAVST